MASLRPPPRSFSWPPSVSVLLGYPELKVVRQFVPHRFGEKLKNRGVPRIYLNFDPGFSNLNNQITHQSHLDKDRNIFVPSDERVFRYAHLSHERSEWDRPPRHPCVGAGQAWSPYSFLRTREHSYATTLACAIRHGWYPTREASGVPHGVLRGASSLIVH